MAIKKMISSVSAIIEAPDLWERLLPAKYADQCPRLVETPKGLAWTVAGKMAKIAPYGALAGTEGKGSKNVTRAQIAEFASPRGRHWLQDRDGIAGEVLYSLGDVWTLINASEHPDFIAACYHAYNDWLGEFVKADPDRFIGIAKIPTTGIDDATKELARAKKSGLRGAVLDVWPAGAKVPPGAKKCDAFWEAAAGLDMPVSIYAPLNGQRHEADGIEAGVAPEFAQDISAMMFANVFDRHPKLRVVSVAPNIGWAPHMFEGMNESYMRTAALRKVSLGNPDLYPSDYLRRFIWYTTQDDRTAILNRAYFGPAHVMWGSFAFTGESVWPNTRQLFERLTTGVPEHERELLASDVTARLYGIGKAKPFLQSEVEEYSKYGLL